MNITPQVREIIDYAQRKIKRVTKEDIRLYPIPANAGAWFTWDKLCMTVCAVVNVDLLHVKSGWRKREVVLARHLIWYYGVLYNFGSLKTLGDLVNGSDHTTVLAAVRRLKGLLQTGDELAFGAVTKINNLLEAMKPEEPVDIPF